MVMADPLTVSAQTSKPSKSAIKKPKGNEKKAKGAGKKKGPASQPISSERLPPHIACIFPAGGQRGTTIEVTVGGQGFLDVESVRISGEGVGAAVSQTVDDKKLILSITVDEDASLGERDLRIITPGGASNRIRFLVGQLPETNEIEPNSQMAQAQRLPSLPMTVDGRVSGGDIDFYRFPAKAGQTLVLQVQARALQPFIADAVPGWMQATMTLNDSTGRQLAYVDDFRSDPDPLFFFTVPKDGEYVVEVKDAIFRGRNDFVYRLSIGALPYITHIYPLGARCGTT
ncbi:MAG TPA: PPC domain-containing protein, partial [Phycisphaerae bacterium]|nr:PPC domain-containing protein [Phycisphaerae bacterium]